MEAHTLPASSGANIAHFPADRPRSGTTSRPIYSVWRVTPFKYRVLDFLPLDTEDVVHVNYSEEACESWIVAELQIQRVNVVRVALASAFLFIATAACYLAFS